MVKDETFKELRKQLWIRRAAYGVVGWQVIWTCLLLINGAWPWALLCFVTFPLPLVAVLSSNHRTGRVVSQTLKQIDGGRRSPHDETP